MAISCYFSPNKLKLAVPIIHWGYGRIFNAVHTHCTDSPLKSRSKLAAHSKFEGAMNYA